jgi:hypothetical protein
VARLTAPLARVLPYWGARWVRRRRDRHRRESAPLAPEALRALAGFFPEETLAVARVAIVPRLSISRLLGVSRRLGFQTVDVERILGITYLDTIVVPERRAAPLSNAVLFHELVHVEQARQLGVRAFVERYVRGWLEAGRDYVAIPLERDAYELERRFRAAPDAPFDVAAEVAHRLTHSRA